MANINTISKLYGNCSDEGKQAMLKCSFKSIIWVLLTLFGAKKTLDAYREYGTVQGAAIIDSVLSKEEMDEIADRLKNSYDLKD